jgi:flagellar basal-body rod protein FlgC
MKVFNSIEISASGLSAERLRMDVTANNIANVETTRTPDGGPYRRQMVVFEPRGGEAAPFQLPTALQGFLADASGADDSSDAGSGQAAGFGSDAVPGFGAGPNLDLGGNFSQGQGVRVVGVVSDPSPPRMVYEPGHPDADANGYVAMPNVSTVNEMVDMMSAQRAYEANVAAIDSAKSMFQQAISIVGQSTAY